MGGGGVCQEKRSSEENVRVDRGLVGVEELLSPITALLESFERQLAEQDTNTQGLSVWCDKNKECIWVV